MDEKNEKRHEWFARMKTARTHMRRVISAIEENDIQTVKNLIENNKEDIDLNFALNSVTALEYSLLTEKFEIAQLLVDLGADVDILSSTGTTLLTHAAREGHVQMAQFLINANADLEVVGKHFETALSCAIESGSTDISELLIKAGAALDKPIDKKYSLMMLCSQHNQPEILDQLISAGADLDYMDGNKKTALLLAIELERSEMACTLIDSGCDINHVDRYGCTALWYAAIGGETGVVKALVKAGSLLDTQDHRGATAFMEAVKGKHQDIVRLLAEAGCDVNAAEKEYRYSPLHTAILMMTQVRPFRDNVNDEYDISIMLKEEHFQLVKLLVDLGCDLRTLDKAGFTPLHHAAFGLDLAVVELLLSRGALVNSVTFNLDSVLQLAVYGDCPEIANVLIQAGADVNLGNKNNEAPLYTAIEHKVSIQVIEALIKAGSHTEVKERVKGQSPLFAAIKASYPAAVATLLQAGVDVNQTNHLGDTALWVACDAGETDIVDALLRHPDVDVDRGIAHVPLHAAVLHGHEDIVRKLLNAGCRVNKLTDICSSALYFAAEFNNITLAKLLISLGADPQAHHRVPLPQKCCAAYRDAHPHLEQEPLQAAIRNDNFSMVKVIMMACPKMPYRVLGLMRDIMFRTNYARDARMTQIKLKQFKHFFAMILSRPRSLQESSRGVIRVRLGERPLDKVQLLPLPLKLKDYILLKESILKDI